MPPDVGVLLCLLGMTALLGVLLPFMAYFLNMDSDEKQSFLRAAGRCMSYYFPFSDFTQGAVGVASERLHAPGLTELMKMTPGQVTAHLGLDEKKSGRKVIDSVVRVLQGEFRPFQIYVGGSFKKNTALKARSDVDLVMKMTNFSHHDLSEYYEQAARALWQAFGRGIEVVSERTSPFYVLSFVVAAGLHFDLVFTCSPDSQGVPREFRSASTSHVADEAIRDFSRSNPLFRALALVCKHWAYDFKGGRRPKSYFVELFAMETIRRGGNEHSVREAFCTFLELVTGCKGEVRVKNLNPNATPSFVSLFQWELFRGYAEETLWECFGRYPEETVPGVRRPRCAGVRDETSPDELRLMSDTDQAATSSLVENPARKAHYKHPQDLRLYFLWRERNPLADSHFEVWQGDHRYVCRGEYSEGPRRGQPCVVKWFKDCDVYEDAFFEKDLMAVRKSSQIVDSFNVLLRAQAPFWPYTVRVNSPGVWTEERTGKKKLVEPFLSNFTKFNSNTGKSEGGILMQALSHFSYHISGGQCLLCDVQGQAPGEFGRTYTLTDPVICSRERSYGPTDLGMEGIENFFYYHECSGHCGEDWSRARGVPHFSPSWGSLMVG